METGQTPLYHDPVTGEMRVGDFASFFRLNYARVFAQVAWITRDRGRASEITQESFTRLFLKWEKVRKYDRPDAWVRTVAVRLAVKRSTREKRQVVGEIPDFAAPAQVDVGVQIDIKKAVETLPTAQRAAVLYFYFYDMPVEQVANEMGCRDSTVKVHLHRARESLREHLTEMGYS